LTFYKISAIITAERKQQLNLKIIENISQTSEFLKDLETAKEIYIDTETSSTDTITCKLYLVQIMVNDSVYVFNCLKFNQLDYIISLIASKIVVGHNIKFDIAVLYNKTKILLANVFDTMLAEIMLHQGIGIKYVSLYDVVEHYTGHKLDKSIRESFYSNGLLTEITQNQYIYAAEDVIYLKQVKDGQVAKITEAKMLKPMQLEMELIPVVAMMENEGVLLNQPDWTKLMIKAKETSKSIAEELKQIFIRRFDRSRWSNLYVASKELGIAPTALYKIKLLESITNPEDYTTFFEQNINISSSVQLNKLLNIVGYPELKTTAEKVITDYRGKDKDQIFEKIIEFREQFKKGSSFGQSFLDAVHPVTGRIHADFNQLGTATGRFSSGNPNLQQIVKGSDYRKCFIAPPGWKMIICDYSQQELKLAGAASKEPEIIHAYKERLDLHSLTASALFEKDISEISEKERSIAKGFNFAVLYGSSEYGLAYNFGLPVEYMKKLLDNFYKKYTVLRDFKIQFEDAVFARKYSRTLLGRIRYFEDTKLFPDANAAYSYERKVRREGFNHLIQGTAADVTKMAMCDIFYKNPFGENLHIIMTIHDEIVCIVKEDCANTAKDFIVGCMNNALQQFLGDIPSEVDWSIEDYWYKTPKKGDKPIEQIREE
jgi:DNA polymerase I